MNHQKQRMLHDAAWDGRTDIILFLLSDPEVDIAGQHSCALLHAAHRGHAEALRLLLPRSDARAHRSEALLRAATHRHRTCVRLLLDHSDPTQWYPHEWEAIRPEIRAIILGKTAGQV
jgi:hypothetical protein